MSEDTITLLYGCASCFPHSRDTGRRAQERLERHSLLREVLYLLRLVKTPYRIVLAERIVWEQYYVPVTFTLGPAYQDKLHGLCQKSSFICPNCRTRCTVYRPVGGSELVCVSVFHDGSANVTHISNCDLCGGLLCRYEGSTEDHDYATCRKEASTGPEAQWKKVGLGDELVEARPSGETSNQDQARV
jgi:hypothetical protein